MLTYLNLQKDSDNLLNTYRANSFEATHKLARSFISTYPCEPLGWLVLGSNFRRIGKLRYALKSFKRVLSIDATNAPAHSNLCNVFREMKLYDEALRHANWAVQHSPNLPEAHNNRGLVFLDLIQPVEARQCFSNAIRLNPNYAAAHYNLGNALIALNNMQEAEASLRRAAELDPRDSKYHNNLATVLRKLNRLSDAKSHLITAISVAPNFAEAYNNLGNVLVDLGDTTVAGNYYQKAIELNPKIAEFYINFASNLYGLGRCRECVIVCQEAIKRNSSLAEPYVILGDALRDIGDPFNAINCYKRALELDESLAKVMNNLGVAYSTISEFSEAKKYYLAALKNEPNLFEAKVNLGWLFHDGGQHSDAFNCALDVLVKSQNNSAKRLIVRCLPFLKQQCFSTEQRLIALRSLAESWARPTELVPLIQSVMLQEQRFYQLVENSSNASQHLILTALLQLLSDDEVFKRMFEITLTSAPLIGFKLEQFLTKLRHQVLIEVVGSEPISLDMLQVCNLLGLIAQQCYINEYVYTTSHSEAQLLAQIQGEISNKLQLGEPISEAYLLLVASYRSLASISNYEGLTRSSCSSALECVLRQQIREPQIEQSLRSMIPRLTEIQDVVSLAVRNQYEENPYPRWVRLNSTLDAKPINQRIRDLFPRADFTLFPTDLCPTVLVAGCGTGQQPIEVACLLKNSEVLAVDLSMASLAYAKRKALESCVNNVSFAQADILKLRELNRKFDVIESTGVLHHMRDPFEAWDILLSLLKPNGIMKIGLYSQIARRHIVKLRELIAVENIEVSTPSIVSFRQSLLQKIESEDYGWVLKSTDFYSTSGCRDLLFNVNEYRLTLPAIDSYMAKRALRFLGFEMDRSITMAYQQKFPEDKLGINLSNWHVFEQENPDSFNGMYQFWIQAC